MTVMLFLFQTRMHAHAINLR